MPLKKTQTIIRPDAYLKILKEIFEETGNPEVAEKQMKYMRNQFAYYGMKAPVFMPIFKSMFKEYGVYEREDLPIFVKLCLEEEYRELFYFALEMVQKTLKKQEADFIDTLEFLILQDSWWDTVDWIAKLVGKHFQRYPELIIPSTEKWMASGNIWLQRVSIIFQLFYREKTDEKLMYKYILQVADSKEFFLQKAAGWALRQYSRTNAESVLYFIDNHELAALTKREGQRLVRQKK